MNSLLNEEQHIWKQLVKYHFTKDQLRWSLRMIAAENSFDPTSKHKSIPVNIEIDQNADPIIDQNGNKPILHWERLFHLLRK